MASAIWQIDLMRMRPGVVYNGGRTGSGSVVVHGGKR